MATTRKPPAKKAAAKRAPRTKKPAAADQDRAIKWAVAHGAPIAMLIGWDPATGVWADTSPVGKMLTDIRTKGAHLKSASKRHNVRHIYELVAKGQEYLADSTLSEDRTHIPIDIRPFVDLADAVDQAEAEAELTVVERAFVESGKDAKVGLVFLARRFPDRWREQQQIHSTLEHDPREAAISEMMTDPTVVLQLAAFARTAEERAARLDDSDNI